MPKTYYFASADQVAAQYDTLTETAPAAIEEASGWVVGTNSAFSKLWKPNTVQPATGYANLIGSSFSELGYRTAGALNGTFAAGDWVASIKVKCGPTYFAQRGFVSLRLWRAGNADGSGATQITSAWKSHIVPPPTYNYIEFVAVDEYVAKTITVPLAAVTLTGEYLFVEFAWSAVTSGGNAAATVYWVQNEGSAEQLLTPAFTLHPADTINFVYTRDTVNLEYVRDTVNYTTQ